VLLYETNVGYEADLLQAALGEDGIPCLRLHPPGVLPPTLSGARLYVQALLAPAAREVLFELFGRRETEA
jgi:hypothetical protein